MKSPPNGKACVAHTRRISQTSNSTQNNSRSPIAQPVCASQLIWWRWEVEAGRLFSLFGTTANAKHLRAFAAHVTAMRGLPLRRLQ